MSWFEKAKMLLEKWKLREARWDSYFQNFTPRTLELITVAREEALRLNHNFLGTEHLLLGLLKLNEGNAAKVLQHLGVGLKQCRMHVEKLVGRRPEPRLSNNIPYTPRTKRVFELAMLEAKILKTNFVDTEHLLLGMLAESQGVAIRVLRHDFKLNLDLLRQEVLKACTQIAPPTQEGQN
jgi:ATP-dependent Clp protease ATP-binding subunit ClpC